MARAPAGARRVLKENRVAPARFLGWGLVIAGGILGIAFFDSRTHARVFVACTALASIAYLRTIWLLGRLGGGSNRLLALCLVLAAAWRVPLLLKPPTLSTDVYRYVWDGRLQRLGYDPYIVVPSDSAVRHLHTAETRLMNHPDFPTPYPAAAELFFRAVTMVDESARAMKSAIFLCDAALVAVLLWWLSASNRSRWWVLAYAWNPLVALEGVGNGHIDLLGVLCLVLTAAALARGRRTVAAIAFALAVGVKFLPLILVPLFWGRIRLRDAALGVGVLAALYIPFIGHGQLPLGSLGGYLARWRVQRTGLFGPRVGLSDEGAGRGSSGCRLRGRTLDALAFGPRLTGGLGLAGDNDAPLRARDFPLVSRLDYSISVHSARSATCGLDSEFARGLLAASRLGDNGDRIRVRSRRSGVHVGAIDGSASRDELRCLKVRRGSFVTYPSAIRR